MKKILIMGAGGTALNVIDLLLHEQNIFQPVGVIDPIAQGDILGVPVLGNDQILPIIKKELGVKHIFPAVGFGDNVNNTLRKKLYNKAKKHNYKIPNIISKNAFVRHGVEMGEGNLVQAGSILDTKSILGNNINIGLNVAIGHKSEIHNHVTIAGSVNINGGVIIGEGTFLGMSCSIYKNVGSWCKISPSVSTLKAVPDNSIVFGQSVRIINNFQMKNN